MVRQKIGSWLALVVVAVFAVGAMGAEASAGPPEAMVQPLLDITRCAFWADPFRLISMHLGIISVGYTYLCVWQNFRRTE